MKAIPPLNVLFNMTGLKLPSLLKGEDKKEEEEMKE